MGPMTAFAVELGRVRDSSTRLLATVRELDEAAMRAPSLLPGWSRTHVMVHLARNADAQVRMIDGALRGESVEQYAGGERGRAWEIEEGTAADAGSVLAGLEASVAALDERWATLPEHAWDLETVTSRFRRTVREGIAARWREVEIHHVDLGCDYGCGDWPAEFVDAFLERTISRLPARLPTTGQDAGRCWRFVDRDTTRDTTRTWRVDAASVRSGDGPGDGSGDAEVSGTGWQLLAWLIGRGDHGLKVTGHAGGLPDLPAWG